MIPIDRVISQAREIGFEVVAELDPKTIVLREDVRAMCAEGKCHAYGKLDMPSRLRRSGRMSQRCGIL